MAAETRTWEEVLAAVERDAARAEALVRADTEQPPADGPVRPEWRLPGAVLPDLAEMPDVPAELRERVEALRDRIDALSAELAEVLREWPGAMHARRARPLLASAVARTEPSCYVDRRV